MQYPFEGWWEHWQAGDDDSEQRFEVGDDADFGEAVGEVCEVVAGYEEDAEGGDDADAVV